MLGASLLVAAAGILGLASAQTPMTTSSGPATTSSGPATMSSATMSSAAAPSVSAMATPVSGPYAISAGAVPIETAGIWCRDQQAACSEICGNSVDNNDCFADSLTYLCRCSSGNTPDLSKYNNTLPWYECNSFRDACVAGNTTNSDNQALCLGIRCGGKLPVDAQTSSSSTMTSSMMTMTSGTAQTQAAPTSSGAAMVNMPREGAHALGAVAAGAFALFAL